MNNLKFYNTHNNYLTDNFILPNVSYCYNNNDIHYNSDNRLIIKYKVIDSSTPCLLHNEIQSATFKSIEINNKIVDINPLGEYLLDEGVYLVKFELIGTSIPTGLFLGCNNIMEVKFPKTITSIGDSAFTDCENLLSIYIPSNITSIGDQAFLDCPSVSSIVVDENNPVYDSRDNCNAIILTKDSYRSNEPTLIQACKNTTIPDDYNEYLIKLEDLSFAYLDISDITIPESVTELGSMVFIGCNLASITCLSSTAPTISNNTFKEQNEGGVLYVPTGSTGYDTWMGTGNYYLGKYNWTKIEQ